MKDLNYTHHEDPILILFHQYIIFRMVSRTEVLDEWARPMLFRPASMRGCRAFDQASGPREGAPLVK